jgi:hypothetical protein
MRRGQCEEGEVEGEGVEEEGKVRKYIEREICLNFFQKSNFCIESKTFEKKLFPLYFPFYFLDLKIGKCP